jgi:uncharacterized protein involved in exopolysaccharide biosynthesis
MPITRRDETPDPLGPNLLYLWQRRVWILVPALVVLALTYLAMRFVSQEYKATGAIYVNRLMTGQERDETLSPATVAQLLESNMLLMKVRDEFMQAFHIERMVEFEKFAKRFKVKTDVLQDTTVRKDVSPVIELEVQSDGTSETRFLMESWIRNFVKMYGNVAADEAVQKRDDLARHDYWLNKEIQKAETERATLRAKLALQEKLLAQNLDILAPVEPSQRGAQVQRRPVSDLDNRSIGDSTVQVSVNAGSKGPGLLSRLADVRVQLLSSAGSNGTSSPAQLKAEEAAIATVIRDTETSISELQASMPEMQAEVARLDREIEYKRGLQDRLHVSMNRFDVAAKLFTQANRDGMPAGGDLRAISMPVQPELRVWPKRTFVAAGAAVAAMLLIVVALLLHRYLQNVALREAAQIE